jgi:hypothetical protein
MTGHKPPVLQVGLNLSQLGILGRLTLIAAVAKVGPTSPFYADAEAKVIIDKVIAHGTTLTTANNDAETKKKEATAAITLRDQETAAADADINLLRALALVVCKSEADLHQLGLARRIKAPPVPLTAPGKVTVAPGKKAKGTIDVHALRIPGLTKYICAISLDPVTPTSYTVLNGAAAKRTISGLDSGKGYWIKYCTERRDQRSEWSAPVYCVAS